MAKGWGGSGLVAGRTVAVGAILSASLSALAGESLPPGASACLGCHSSKTSSEHGEISSLADLPPDRIAAALTAYRTGQRDGTIMPRIAQGFSEAETLAIAAALGRPERAAP